MDFIPGIVDPAHSPLKVPNLYEPRKSYKPGGLWKFLGYVHNEGFNLQHICEGDFHGKTWREAASFVQRWAYWGMILEIFHIGGLRGIEKQAESDADDAVARFSGMIPLRLYTWECIVHDPDSPDAADIESSRFADIVLILARVNAFYTRLCARESTSIDRCHHLKRARKKGSAPKLKSCHVYEKHMHPLSEDDRVDYDDLVISWDAKDTFYNGEPHAVSNVLDSPGHALIISIGAAGELLSQATKRRFKREIPHFKWKPPMTLVRRLDQAGWCPVWLRKLRDEGSVARAYYLSSIPREPRNKHAHCCPFGCIANQMDKQVYVAKHATENCSCEMVSFDLGNSSEYAEWIRDGYSPLIIRKQNEATGQVQWELIRSHDKGSSEVKRYVAISHVWGDGTGSVNGNCLHACQLEKFHNGAKALYNHNSNSDNDAGDLVEEGESSCLKGGGGNQKDHDEEVVPFWVDTICVPFHQGQLKILAIQKMERIYRNADKVLVFDSALQQFDLSRPTNECLTQIEISSWNQRLWTIQEAAFAKELYFKFKIGTATATELQMRYRLERFVRNMGLRKQLEESKDAAPRLLQIILDSLLHPLEDPEVFSKPPGEFELRDLELDMIFLGTSASVPSFIYTLKLPVQDAESAQTKWGFLDKVLPYRQTSIAADEGLCLSTLLGMDLGSLYKLPDEERIRRMFLHIGTIDSGILFSNRPRLEKPGYRWMPSTFVTQRLERSNRTAEVTEAGVKVKLPGFIVKFPSKGFMSTLDPDEEEKPFGFLEMNPDDPDDSDEEFGPGGPKHLVGASFPMHIEGTEKAFIVDMHLPKDSPGIEAIGSALIIIVEEELIHEELPEMDEQPLTRIWKEWKQLQQKRLIEAIVVQGDALHSEAVHYTVSATIHSFDNPTPEQLEYSAAATPLRDTDWVIS